MNLSDLGGFRVLVTRPAHQADALAETIEAAGGQAIRFPVIDIRPRAAAEIERDVASLPDPHIAIFVSRNAVEHGQTAIRNESCRIAAIGPATCRALEDAGTPVHIVPETGYDSEHLLEHPALGQVAGRAVWILRGDDGRELLADTLRRRGADVYPIAVYSRVCAKTGDADRRALEEIWATSGIDCVTVMSVASLECLLELLPPETRARLRQTPLVAPSARVLQTAAERLPGLQTVRAAGPQPVDMLRAISELQQSGFS